MRLFSTQKSWGQTMLKATRLMQRSLLGGLPKAAPAGPGKSAPAANDPHAEKSPPAVIILPLRPTRADNRGDDDSAGRKASFSKHAFTFEGDSYPYRLYIPAATQANADKLMPLVVLLHGCKQDALDFAHGTAMNAPAGEHNAMVLYPEQIISGNAMRCWNWFDPSHQQAGHGEPGMIAALTQKMIDQEQADPTRIYVAGLSAGGAMAAVVAHVYPHLFAAVGVHSGLAAGAAQSMLQAFTAMQEGAKGMHTTALPTIVFHGTADQTVNPTNAKYVTQAALAAFKSEGLELVKTKFEVDAKKDEPAERTLYSNARGKPFVESWRVTAGPHAWSGGNAAGSYTDPDGPDASKAMLAFFLRHHKGESAQ